VPIDTEQCEIISALTLADRLAVERTQLANETTLLAYIRTALAIAAGGGTLLQFFSSHPALFAVGWVLMASAGGLLAFGINRFVAVRRRVCTPPDPMG
jgi:putative membrane protein